MKKAEKQQSTKKRIQNIYRILNLIKIMNELYYFYIIIINRMNKKAHFHHRRHHNNNATINHTRDTFISRYLM